MLPAAALAYNRAMTRQTLAAGDPPLAAMAWNGVSLDVPGDWRPARLGLGYLYFEDPDGPAFEFKWRPGAGRKGMEAALRALTPKGEASAGATLPPEWLRPLHDFELMPLSWSKNGRAGLGAALFCPECGMAAVFQAFGPGDGPDAAMRRLVAKVLASLRHHDPGPPAFRLFGLSFTPPSGFMLCSHTFVPGRFSLSFAAGRQRLDIVRLAPADVLLERSHLAEVAALAFGCDDRTRREEGSLAGCPAVWLASRQGTGFPDALARGLGRQGRLCVMRHEAGVNKLLGAGLASGKPVDRQWLEKVASHCVSL
ncbi:conserved hypothetical protein [Solidesulfovibrio fructosivorans JJ]]|uniref:Uncharacterized protein n=1 Tax=Solidesulfovibrio fructosivorans JJ] TaxID=596151 RepID=E1JVY7_SOLFR|nr:hypothetical protein [Solidesulfovibrio fructosivorans]EFL51625.1 conserved hypothetical protein [Solidesulfovibrio fructosivorans JJ]]